MSDWLVLRPEPGATATARRIAALGRQAIVTPLFEISPLEWTPPPAERFDSLLVTSANAARQAADKLENYRRLPVYAVGEATAAALAAAGIGDIRVGAGDARALLDRMAGDGRRAALHLAGEDRREVGRDGIAVTRIAVYRATAVAALPAAAAAAIAGGTLALLHSPRAAALFAGFVADRRAVAIAAISPAALAAAGQGWRAVAAAPTPDDDALLAVAAALCEDAG